MHRIDSTGAVNGMWQNGNPTAGLMSTRGDATYWNAMQEEVCNCVESAGLTLIKGDYTQLRTAIRLHQVGPVILGPNGWHAHGDYAAQVELAAGGGKRFLTANTDAVTVAERELELPTNAVVTGVTIRYGRTGTDTGEFLVYLRRTDAAGTETTIASWDLHFTDGEDAYLNLNIPLARNTYAYALVVSMTNAIENDLKLYSITVQFDLK